MTTQGALRDDLLDPELNHDPWPFFARLREEDPVHYSPAHRAWIVTRYDDVVEALGHPALSSDRVRPLLDALTPENRAKAGGVMAQMAEWMVVTDPPAHTRLRRLATNAFHPRKVVAMEGRIRELVDGYLDSFIASGEQDLIAAFTFPLPATLISELIGAPSEDADRFKDWSNDLALVAFGAGGEGRDDRHALAERSIAEMFEYFGVLIEKARREPGEDMISDLIAGDGTEENLTDDEIRSMCALMLFAGHETTTTTITSAVKLLIDHPDQLELVRADPKLSGKAVEESLRVEGAIKILHRWVIEDFELRGKTIRKGDRVLVSPAAANRDPEKFPDPDRFLITRSPNAHVAFGKGVHACIGAMLARIEMRVAIARIVERLPGLRYAEGAAEPTWVPSLAARALTELRIEHDATL
ncbi:cytochrome P450 [Baekduia soli]|uniref:Cytochrome P450 n=1 Tax=Baekduia soli TaxID=496014 RepID=A0A5B8UCE5_9ACTN|nr:cytochrome P450 [Baekduia soli]QEC50518.1 cytochrome P450 [Baekduia soli]